MRALLHLLLAGIILSGCDLFDNTPPVAEVVLVGTRVDNDLLDTGTFELIATPLDDEGSAILDGSLRASVEIDSPSGIRATTTRQSSDTDRDRALRVALLLDESGSMTGTDPSRLRVAGAITFTEQLAATAGLDWEAAVFSYSSAWRLRSAFTRDLAVLRAGIQAIGASGGTQTYGALETSLFNFASGPTSSRRLRRAIVLFSDGQPSDTFRRDAVCAEAVRLDVVVHSIGLGPASDIAENDPGAVEEMRAIANCTGGAYAGIAPGGSTTIDAVYQALATATSQGSLTYTVRMSGEGFEGLASGDRISGRFRIEGGGEEAEAPFQFTVR